MFFYWNIHKLSHAFYENIFENSKIKNFNFFKKKYSEKNQIDPKKLFWELKKYLDIHNMDFWKIVFFFISNVYSEL